MWVLDKHYRNETTQLLGRNDVARHVVEHVKFGLQSAPNSQQRTDITFHHTFTGTVCVIIEPFFTEFC